MVNGWEEYRRKHHRDSVATYAAGSGRYIPTIGAAVVFGILYYQKAKVYQDTLKVQRSLIALVLVLVIIAIIELYSIYKIEAVKSRSYRALLNKIVQQFKRIGVSTDD